MLDATKLLVNALGEHLALVYRRTFGSREPGYVEVIEESARLTIERIVQSDALYHDADHITLVTPVAQDILRGRFSASCALSARSPHPAGNSPRRNNRPTAL